MSKQRMITLAILLITALLFGGWNVHGIPPGGGGGGAQSALPLGLP